MLLDIISKLEEMQEGWTATAQECKDFGDTTGAAYSRGVATGIADSIEKINKMMDEELEKMAAGK